MQPYGAPGPNHFATLFGQIRFPGPVLLLAHHFEAGLDTIQAVHTKLELLRQTPEERRHTTVLELIERADDPVGLLAGPDVIDEAVEAESPLRQGRNVLRKHAGHKQGVV